jgi:hypothetical protein
MQFGISFDLYPLSPLRERGINPLFFRRGEPANSRRGEVIKKPAPFSGGRLLPAFLLFLAVF